jgi:hypothetical protein
LVLKLLKNAEIWLPTRILPLVIRSEKITAVLAVYSVMEEQKKSLGKN